MSSTLIECPVDAETLLSIRELRQLRLEILRAQISDIDHVMNRLLIHGVIPFGEEEKYRGEVLSDLSAQYRLQKDRIAATEIVYADELKLYYDLMNSAQ